MITVLGTHEEQDARVRDAGRWRKVVWLFTVPDAADLADAQLRSKGIIRESTAMPTTLEGLTELIDAIDEVAS